MNYCLSDPTENSPCCKGTNTDMDILWRGLRLADKTIELKGNEGIIHNNCISGDGQLRVLYCSGWIVGNKGLG